MTQVAQKPNLLNQPNSFFRKGDFEALIQMKGYDLELSKACKCPCMTAENHALPSCTNCNGYGWFFINPIMTRGLLSSINLNTKFKEWSEELLGTAALTLREGQRISFMDRIIIKNSANIDNKVIYSENLTLRGNTGSEFVFLSFRPIDIIAVHVFNGDSKKLYFMNATTYSIDSTVNEYILKFNFDFSQVSDFNNVVSVLYKHELQYHVLDIQHDIRNSFKVDGNGRDAQIVLPISGIVRKANNILSIKDRNGEGTQDNSIPEGIAKWVLQNGLWNDNGVFNDSSIWQD